jgi:hypothetical protein
MSVLRRLKASRWNRRQGWIFTGLCSESETSDSWPVNFWSAKWSSVGHSVKLLDPEDGEPRMVPCYLVEKNGRRFGFAVDEFSDGRYGFFLPV